MIKQTIPAPVVQRIVHSTSQITTKGNQQHKKTSKESIKNLNITFLSPQNISTWRFSLCY